jgi:hypothetical protein
MEEIYRSARSNDMEEIYRSARSNDMEEIYSAYYIRYLLVYYYLLVFGGITAQ